MKNKVNLIFIISISIFFFFAKPSFAAPWSGIIDPSRAIDWSYTGIPGGIPTRTTICATIDAATYGNGTTDATSIIQTALNNCPSGQVVYVPAGTYLINGTINMVSNVTLRGAGQGVTILKAGGSSRNNLITLADAGIWDELYGSPLTHNITSAVKDSQTVTLDSVSGISVGDVLLLNQLNDGTEVTQYGMSGGKQSNCGPGVNVCPLVNGTRALGQFVQVTGISGNQVSINVPLHWTYNTSLTPWAYVITGSHMLRYAGLENLTLTQDSAIVNWIISVDGAQYCWIKGVEMSNIQTEAILTYELIQSEIQGNYIHTCVNGRGYGQCYGIAMSIYSSNNLVDNNIVYDVANGGLETHGGASGNVLSYNYLYNIYDSPISWAVMVPALNHGAHPKMNLWEGDTGYKFQADDVWGSSSHLTVFRSRSFGYFSDSTTDDNAAIQFSPLNHYMNVVGSVLGTPGKSTDYEADAGGVYSTSKKYIWVLGISNQGGSPDSEVVSTTFRHGNYDYVTNSTHWDSSISNHTLPASLYLSSKPSWWCNETPWPPIGPDVAGLANAIPAERKFEGLICTTGGGTPPDTTPPAPPTGVVVQ